jgi:outer membrane receptor protein involved in Fe transport
MSRWLRPFFLVIFLGLFICSYAQNAKLSGKVTNSKNEALSGVSIKLTGESGGTATDIEGRYTLNLATGKKYELEFSIVGYESKIVSDVEAVSGQVNELNIVLEIKAASGENVVVTGRRTSARLETVASIISFQKNTNTVASVISAESIRRSPDKNTGEVLKRIPGTSIQDGKYIIVRGLTDRYNQAMLNGIQLSSTEPDRKAFSFDVFPAAMIDNIIINKAFVPEYPAEWAGGLIQVNTKDIPPVSFFNIQVGTGFNSQTIGNKFYTYEGGKLDWLGIDDGARALPSNTPGKNGFKGLSSTDKINLGKQIATNWSVQEAGGVPLNTSFQASGGFNKKVFGKDLGVILALTYNRSNRRLQYENHYYNAERGVDNPSVFFDYYNNKYSQDVLAGALANVSLKLNANNKISFKNVLNVNSSDFVNLRTGKDYDQNGDNIRARELAFRSNVFFNTQLNGEHNLNISNFKTKLNWYGSFGILDQYIPQQRRVQYNQPESPANAPYTLLIGGALSQKTGSVFYSNLSDYIYNAGGDLTTPFNLFGNKQTIKVGYLFQVKDRLYNARPFSITLPSNNNALRSLSEDEVFAPQNFSDGTQQDKFFFDEYSDIRFRYLANSILNAGYIQFDNQFSKWLRVVWGARYENFDQLIGSVKQSDERHAHSKVEDFLPAINTTFKLNNKTNIRLSGSQTVVRPEFRELSDLAFYDFELGATVIGSRNLKRTKVNNADLRFELYPRAGELFTIGVFYKFFKNPIEQYFNPSSGGSSQFNFLNVDKATSYGVEFEMRKKLDFADALKNFTFQTNLAYIYNRVKDDLVNIDRPMQGQSPYVINATLQYDLEKIGLNTTLLFNQIGRRILYVGNDQISDIWEAPRPLFDFQIAKKLVKNKAELRFNVSDILNRRAYYYHDQDENGSYKTASSDRIAIKRNFGTNFSVTFGYTFK